MTPEQGGDPVDLFRSSHSEKPALILPEEGVQITYGALRERVHLPSRLSAIVAGLKALELNTAVTLDDKQLSAAEVAASIDRVVKRYGLRAEDVCLCVMPVWSAHGLVESILATLVTGGTVVVPAAFNPLTFWRMARDYGVTWYTADPRLHQWLLARSADPGGRRPAGARTLRFIRSVGEPLPPPLAKAIEAAFGVDVIDDHDAPQ